MRAEQSRGAENFLFLSPYLSSFLHLALEFGEQERGFVITRPSVSHLGLCLFLPFPLLDLVWSLLPMGSRR